jgi:hypothetical protein
MGVMLPMMFPSFDDRIEEIQPIDPTIFKIVKEFQEGNFPIGEIMELGIPLIGVPTEEKNYSSKQRAVQDWVKSNPRWVRRVVMNPSIPPTVKVPIVLATAFVAYGNGGRGPAMSSPEIRRYDESAFGAPGVGGYSII